MKTSVFLWLTACSLLMLCISCGDHCDGFHEPLAEDLILFKIDTASLGITGADLDTVTVERYNKASGKLETSYPVRVRYAPAKIYTIGINDVIPERQNRAAGEPPDFIYKLRQKEGKFNVRVEDLYEEVTDFNKCSGRLKFISVVIEGKLYTSLPYTIQ